MIKITKFLIALLAIFISTTVKAQLPLPITPGLPIGLPVPKVLGFANFTYAIPQGDFSKGYDNGTGVEVGAGLGLGKTMIVGSVGYINYQAKVNGFDNFKVVPIKLGIRRYLIAGIFINAQVGLATETYTGSDGKSNNNNGFLYEGGAGIKIFKVIEIGAAYTGYNTASLAGINTAPALLIKTGLALKL